RVRVVVAPARLSLPAHVVVVQPAEREADGQVGHADVERLVIAPAVDQDLRLGGGRGVTRRCPQHEAHRDATADQVVCFTTGFPSVSYTSTPPTSLRIASICSPSPTATISSRDGSRYFLDAACTWAAVTPMTRSGYLSQ